MIKLKCLPRIFAISLLSLTLYLIVTHYFDLGETPDIILKVIIFPLNVICLILYMVNYRKYRLQEFYKTQVLNNILQKTRDKT